jgi:hypothetical protein
VPRAYSSVNLTPASLDRLRRTTLTVSAALGRRVTTSDVVTALCALGDRHADELARVLADEGSDAE